MGCGSDAHLGIFATSATSTTYGRSRRRTGGAEPDLPACVDQRKRWPDLIDVDAGRIASGHSTVEEIGWELFHYYLDIASGRAHRIHNDLALFNPAPLT